MMRPLIATLWLLVVVTAAEVNPTSFNFGGVRYSFYPGGAAKSWDEAKAFCEEQGKQLAMFRNKTIIGNLADYLSSDGGVWTGYITDQSGAFYSSRTPTFGAWSSAYALNPADATPSASKAEMCGLLSVAGSESGVRAVNCDMKKAPLCAIIGDDGAAKPTSTPTAARSSSRSSSVAPRATSRPSSSPNNGQPKKATMEKSEPMPSNDKTKGAPKNPEKTIEKDAGKTVAVEATWAPRSKEPREFSVDGNGKKFVFFPNNVLYGGWMEFARFCDDRGLTPAVFTSKEQMVKVAAKIQGVPVWTGYSTDSAGVMHSVDEVNAPWSAGLLMPTAKTSGQFQCGLLAVQIPNRVGILPFACSSPRMALCSK